MTLITEQALGSAEKRQIRIYFFGDSICFGQGVSPHLTWVVRLSAALHARYQHALDIIIQNPSVNGNTTRLALERMPYDIQSHTPHVLFVQFGMNDCNVWQTDKGHPRVSKAAFEQNLTEIVARGRKFGASQIILGTNHPTTRLLPMPDVEQSYDEANRLYNVITRRVAHRCSTTLADVESACDNYVKSGLGHYKDLVLEDELHLSTKGHELYFQTRLPIVAKAVDAVANVLERQTQLAS